MLLKKWYVLFLVLAIFVAGGCGGSDSSSNGPISLDSYSWGVEFEPVTLGLTPGTTISEIGVNWYSSTETGEVSMIRFFDGKNDFKEVTGTVLAITAANAGAGHPSIGNTAHKVTVTGLKADTEYQYWVSNDGEHWSKEYKYKTPKTSSFRFASIGDPQLTVGLQDATSNLFSADNTTAQGWKDTMRMVGLANVNFIAGVGDQVDVTGNGSEAEYKNFFAPPELRSIPWAPSVGNHDRHYPFKFHYNLPNEQVFALLTGAGFGNPNEQTAAVEAAGNYWYRYNNALFVVLNTSSYPVSTDNAALVIHRFDDTLTAAKTASPGYTWLFVQHHKSTASVADHLADRDIQYYVEAGFEELMTTHGVDFVLAGHDHVYARSYPLTGKKGGTPSVPDTTQGGSEIANPNGTIYITMTTGSGLKYYDLFNWSGNLYVKDNSMYPYLVGGLLGSLEYAGSNITNTTGDPGSWVHVDDGVLPLSNAKYLQAKKPSFTVVDVNGGTVTFNTYNSDDTATSIDTFTVTK